jgi:hypothetical protein
MSDGKYQPLTDNMDDLPRTLRRERENRDRAAREQQARDQQAQTPAPAAWDRGKVPTTQSTFGASEPSHPYDAPYSAPSSGGNTVVVERFKVPFFSLMAFFIKAVFAAVPAMLILIAMFYGLGMALQKYFPELIKMKILISFPG